MIMKNTRSQSKRLQVAIRTRPLLETFEDQSSWRTDSVSRTITSLPRKFQPRIPGSRSNSLSIETTNAYEFSADYVFDQASQNHQIYQSCCERLVQGLFSSKSVGMTNGTVFMYGQTTSGKTYTMLGNADTNGIVIYSLENVFKLLDQTNKVRKKDKHNVNQLRVVISYLEVYNEQVNDLLNPSQTNLKIVDTEVPQLTQFATKCYSQAINMLKYGEQQRAYREKNCHDHSSRSHTIFQIKLTEKNCPSQKQNNYRNCKVKGILNLVDLAGSQRLQDDISNQETGYINKSLFVLSNVIQRLAATKKNQSGTNSNIHIPFRDSKLTRLLAPSLTGKSQTIVICTISPASVNFNQTLSTLRFASKSRKVQFRSLTNPISSSNQSSLNISNSLMNESSIYPNPTLQKQQSRNLQSQNNKMIQSLIEQNSQLKKNLSFMREQSTISRETQETFLEDKCKNISTMIRGLKTKYLKKHEVQNNSQENYQKAQNWYRKVGTLCQEYKRNIQILQRQYFKALINATSNQYNIQRNEILSDLQTFQTRQEESLELFVIKSQGETQSELFM